MCKSIKKHQQLHHPYHPYHPSPCNYDWFLIIISEIIWYKTFCVNCDCFSFFFYILVYKFPSNCCYGKVCLVILSVRTKNILINVLIFFLLRHKLCITKGWRKFGNDETLSPQSSTLVSRPTSPSRVPSLPSFYFTDPNDILSPVTCRWKGIYIRAYCLQQNWSCGRYTIAPILRGHKEPVNDIACDGESIVFVLCFSVLCIKQMETCE